MNLINAAAVVIIAMTAMFGLVQGRDVAHAPSLPHAHVVFRMLRPSAIAVALHYLFWYGWFLPLLNAPGSSNTGGALAGMFLLLTEPEACVVVALAVEWLLRRCLRW